MTSSVNERNSSFETTWRLALYSTVLFGVTFYVVAIGKMELFGIGADNVGSKEVARARELAAIGDFIFVAGLAWLSNVVSIGALRPRWRYAAPVVLGVAQMFAAVGASELTRLTASFGMFGLPVFVMDCLLATVAGVELARMISGRLARS
jgi:hypothetical protein